MAGADLMQSVLQLVFRDDTDSETGNPSTRKTKIFNNVKPNATVDLPHLTTETATVSSR